MNRLTDWDADTVTVTPPPKKLEGGVPAPAPDTDKGAT